MSFLKLSTQSFEPSGISVEDVAKLVQKYTDSDHPGYVNYLKISNDLEAMGEMMEKEKASYLSRMHDMRSFLPPKVRQLIAFLICK